MSSNSRKISDLNSVASADSLQLERENRELKKKLVRVSAALKGFASTSNDGFWDWRINDDYEYMSPRFWEILGIDPLSKKHHPSEWQELVFAEDLKKAKKNLEEHLATQGTHPYAQELRFRLTDGNTATVMRRGIVVEWDDKGSPARMVGSHTDLTRLKRAQESLESATKAGLEQMAGGISHEINNPLAVIITNCDWIGIKLDDGTLDGDELRTALKKITKTATRIEAITTNLRTLARHSDKAENTKIRLSKVIQDSLSFCQTKIRGMGIELIVADPEDGDELVCNPILLSQVLINLLNNAKDAVEGKKGARIDVLTELNDKNILVHVRDNGPGIEPAKIEQLFDPFFSTKPVGKGAGLGLSIARGIIQSHGGEIRVAQPAKPTIFEFSLPRDK